MVLGVAGFRPRVHRGPPRRGEGTGCEHTQMHTPRSRFPNSEGDPFPMTQRSGEVQQAGASKASIAHAIREPSLPFRI